MDKINQRAIRKTLPKRGERFKFKIEVPSTGDAQVVIDIVIPVSVEVETLGIEVTEVDMVAIRIDALCLSSSKSPEIEAYFSLNAKLYPLSPEFYAGAGSA